MRKSKYPFKVYNGKLLRESFARLNRYAFLIPFLLGLICGVDSLRRFSGPQQTALAAVASNYVAARSGGWLHLFRHALLIHCGSLLLTLFFAFSAIGCPLILLIPFLQGVGIGVISAYFYGAYQLSGVGYCLLIIYPPLIVSEFALILACRDCWDHSLLIYQSAVRSRGEVQKPDSRTFLVRQCVYLLLCAGSAALEALFGTIFSHVVRL